MIEQTIGERHRENKRIAGFKTKPQQLTMFKFAIAKNGTIQTHPAQIAMRKHTARKIKIGEVGRPKINVRKQAIFIFPLLQRNGGSIEMLKLLLVLIRRHIYESEGVVSDDASAGNSNPAT